jgi:alkylation response protein AidB-like acyl-CoA dehydrogenase
MHIKPQDSLLLKSAQKPLATKNQGPITFGADQFAKEIKDSEGLLNEKGKGAGIFASIFSSGTFPLRLISSVDLELSPEKKAKMEAYNQLLKVGMRPSANPLEQDRLKLADTLKTLSNRNAVSDKVVNWFNEGNLVMNSVLSGKAIQTLPGYEATTTLATAASLMGAIPYQGVRATLYHNTSMAGAWASDGKTLLTSEGNQDKAFQVWAADAQRWMGKMNQFLANEEKVQQALDKPSEKQNEWFKALNLSPDTLRVPVMDANQIDREAYVDSATLERAKALGLFKLKVPKEFGGIELKQKEYHRVVRELPAISGTLGALISAHSTIGSAPLVLNGTKAQREEYLPKIAEGNFLAAFGLTEPGAGTDTKKLKTTASLSPDGKEWIINGEAGAFGEKIYITNTHRSGVMFLMTKTDLGSHYGTPGDNAMIDKWLYTSAKSKKNKKGTVNEFGDPVGTQYADGKTPWPTDKDGMPTKGIDYDYIRKQNPSAPWRNLSNKMLKESIIILDLPFRIQDSQADMKQKMAQLAEQGMVISDPIDLMMIRGSNQAHIRFNNFRVPVNKVLGGVGEDFNPLLEELKKHKDEARVPGLDWRKMTLKGKKLKLDGAGQGMNDVFNALNRGRAGFGPSYSGAVRALLEQSRNHATQREMFDLFGGTQDKMPAIKKYLGEMAQKAAALDAVSELTSALIEEKGDKMNIIDICAAIKVISTEWNWDTAQLAMRIHGGSGLHRGGANGMERAFRDAWIGMIVEGVNEAMKQLTIGVGTGPALGSLGKIFSGKLGAIGGLLGMGVKAMTPAAVSEKGDLNWGDARWIQSRTKQLWRKTSAWGTRYQTKMMVRQNELIRAADIALDLYALSAVMLKLKRSGETLPKEEKVSLETFVNVAKRRIDRNLKEFGYTENPDDRNLGKAADAHFMTERLLLNAAKQMKPAAQ